MDAESIDTDADSASPETNYFKMMMQDNQSGRVNDGTDDSIIGGQTIASVMNNNVTKNGMNANANGSYSVSTAQTPTQNKNESMAIVGVDDDVSTLANDTVNETTKDFFTGQASQQNSKPRMRLFKEYSTPEKKKTNRKKGADGINNSDDDNDDDEERNNKHLIHYNDFNEDDEKEDDCEDEREPVFCADARGRPAGVVLEDLNWRIEKLRLEEANKRRFLKAGPRFLPYTECQKWVQAWGNRWTSAEEWNDWIASGEKRNSYIPSRPEEYFTRIGGWVSWEHFLGVPEKDENSESH
mmetsp:Transcript_17315/g.36169  ORF Transcript_17315/g.36169 Transcript_17315/m.36169 type:complete len:297 (-) Transcript_17315:174-1064(-)